MRDGTVILRESAPPLADGAEVVVTPVGGEPGSPAVVLAAVESDPHVPAVCVDELEALIASGQRPPEKRR